METQQKQTSLKTNLIKELRKSPHKHVKQYIKTERFSDDNMEDTIIDMLNSGLGRRGRRNLYKQIKNLKKDHYRKNIIKWDDFIKLDEVKDINDRKELNRIFNLIRMKQKHDFLKNNILSWDKFLEIETVVAEMNNDKLNSGAKILMINSLFGQLKKLGKYSDIRITTTDFFISSMIIIYDHDRDNLEDLLKKNKELQKLVHDIKYVPMYGMMEMLELLNNIIETL